jgi:hypothetical protein
MFYVKDTLCTVNAQRIQEIKLTSDWIGHAVPIPVTSGRASEQSYLPTAAAWQAPIDEFKLRNHDSPGAQIRPKKRGL